MMQERERARRFATTLVSLALALAGLMLVVLAIVLVIQGGGGLVFLALVLGVLGAGLAVAGFFFQLVPLRVDELAEEKRAYDRRMRDER
jgi:hypothetical protein